jgi:hypothetical protein
MEHWAASTRMNSSSIAAMAKVVPGPVVSHLTPQQGGELVARVRPLSFDGEIGHESLDFLAGEVDRLSVGAECLECPQQAQADGRHVARIIDAE